MSNRNGGMRVSYAAAVKNFSDIEQQAAFSRSIFPAVYFLPPVEAILRINSRSVGGVTISSPSVRPAGGSGFFPAIASAGPADPGDARHKPSTFYRWYDRFQSGGPEALQDKTLGTRLCRASRLGSKQGMDGRDNKPGHDPHMTAIHDNAARRRAHCGLDIAGVPASAVGSTTVRPDGSRRGQACTATSSVGSPSGW